MKTDKRKHGMKSHYENTISSKMYSAGAYSTVSYLFNQISSPMSGLSLFGLTGSIRTENNLPKKLEDLGSNGQKFNFSAVRANVRSN